MQENYVTQLRQGGFDKAGYVYVALLTISRCSKPYFYKIGCSANPEDRIAGMQLPGPARVMHWIETDDMGFAESLLHERFAPKRMYREWFDLCEEDLIDLFAIQRILLYSPKDESCYRYRATPALAFLHELAQYGDMTEKEYYALKKRISDVCDPRS